MGWNDIQDLRNEISRVKTEIAQKAWNEDMRRLEHKFSSLSQELNSLKQEKYRLDEEITLLKQKLQEYDEKLT